MAPETSPDGVAYHLWLAQTYLQAHGFARLDTFYAHMPQGLEMLFLFALAFGRNSSAALVHFAFLMILPLLMLSYGRRAGIVVAAAAAALFVFVSPVVGVDGTTSYNDVAMTASSPCFICCRSGRWNAVRLFWLPRVDWPALRIRSSTPPRLASSTQLVWLCGSSGVSGSLGCVPPLRYAWRLRVCFTVDAQELDLGGQPGASVRKPDVPESECAHHL